MFIRKKVLVYIAAGILPVLLVPSTWTVILWLVAGTLIVVLDAWLAFDPRKLIVQRETTKSMRLDMPANSVVQVQNPHSRRCRGRLVDGWAPSAGAPRNKVPFDLEPDQVDRFSTTLVPQRRGSVHAGPVTIRTYGPLGFAGKQASLAAEGKVLVLPPFRARKYLPSRLEKLSNFAGSTPLLQRGAGSEFDSLREYVRGDDIRDIDWKATARSRNLVVRTWRPEREQDIIIVNDSSRNSAPKIGDYPRIETQLESALLLGALAASAGDKVHYIDIETTIRARVTGTSPKTVINAIATPAADINATLREANWSILPAAISQLTTSSALIVILTAVDSTILDSGLADILARLNDRHTVVLASAVEPELEDLATQISAESDIYEVSAARKTLLDNYGTQVELQALGVTILEGTPENLPTRVADHYIKLKSLGRL